MIIFSSNVEKLLQNSFFWGGGGGVQGVRHTFQEFVVASSPTWPNPPLHWTAAESHLHIQNGWQAIKYPWPLSLDTNALIVSRFSDGTSKTNRSIVVVTKTVHGLFQSRLWTQKNGTFAVSRFQHDACKTIRCKFLWDPLLNVLEKHGNVFSTGSNSLLSNVQLRKKSFKVLNNIIILI